MSTSPMPRLAVREEGWSPAIPRLRAASFERPPSADCSWQEPADTADGTRHLVLRRGQVAVGAIRVTPVTHCRLERDCEGYQFPLNAEVAVERASVFDPLVRPRQFACYYHALLLAVHQLCRPTQTAMCGLAARQTYKRADRLGWRKTGEWTESKMPVGKPFPALPMDFLSWSADATDAALEDYRLQTHRVGLEVRMLDHPL